MRECCPDGELRAFLDRELPADELTRLSAHLEECPRCTLRCRQLAARAERVLELVGGLAELDEAAPPARLPRMPVAKPRRQTGGWVAAAVAVAAGWAALALLAPKPIQAPTEMPAQGPAVTEAPSLAGLLPAPALPLPVRTPNRVRPRPNLRPLPAAPQRATLAGFMALDDDPIDAGVVMRVALAEGRMQADVIYSPDGRPRAIRMVNEATGK